MFYLGLGRPSEYAKQLVNKLAPAGLLGIDTAPNYQYGQAEPLAGELIQLHPLKIFTKVGFTQGDSVEIAHLSGGKQHCYSRDYVSARIQTSWQTVFANSSRQDKSFDCLFLHNPEFVFKDSSEEMGLERIKLALDGLAQKQRQGLIKSIGIASWHIKPYSRLGQKIIALVSSFQQQLKFSYWMTPISYSHSELFVTGAAAFVNKAVTQNTNNKLKLLAMAPLGGGVDVQYMGSPLKSCFDGVENPLSQIIAMLKYIDATPVFGFTSIQNANQLVEALNTGIPDITDIDKLKRILISRASQRSLTAETMK